LTKKVVSGIIYPYNSDKTNVKKLEISKKKSIFTATVGPTDMSLEVLG